MASVSDIETLILDRVAELAPNSNEIGLVKLTEVLTYCKTASLNPSTDDNILNLINSVGGVGG